MAKSALIIIPKEGFESIETITPIDVLTRAGVTVVQASESKTKEPLVVTSAQNVKMTVDSLMVHEDTLFDAVILPGGLPGANILGKSTAVQDVVMKHHRAGHVVAAICATSGTALAPWGILDGKSATCYPSFEKHFPKSATYVDEPVVKDGNVITGAGPGAAFAFSLKLAEVLVSATKAKQIASGMLYRGPK